MKSATQPRRGLSALLAVVAASSLLAACSDSATPAAEVPPPSGTPAASATAADVLGTPKAATGEPVVFGVLNLQSGPVTFPEVLEAEQAAVDYVNAYRGGIGGRPIKLVSCATDGQPSTSARCANQLLEQKPVAILGGADTGSPGAIPVWQRADLAYLGGISFTPVEGNYANAAVFSSVNAANAAGAVYAAQELGAKSAAVIYTSDTAGTNIAEHDIIATFQAVGVTNITKVGIAPTSSDVTSAVATVVGAHPDVVYIDAPAACPAILSSLKQLGSTAKVLGIDPCTSPPAIAAANGGAEGLYFASPTEDPHSGSKDGQLFLAALQKYAAPSIVLDAPAAIGFQTVVNVQTALADADPADLTTAKILAAVRTGTPTPNFLGHDYVCDGKQLPKVSAACNAYSQIRQVQGTSIVTAADYLTPVEFYQG